MEGRIVCSRAGRDRGKWMVIVGEEGKSLLVCDGKERPLARPKRKNPKHVAVTNTRLEKNRYLTDKALRRELALYRDTAPEEEEP